MLSTCSRPLTEVLKMRMLPDWTTYIPRQGSPSPNTISPAEKLLGTVRWERKFSSGSERPAKIAALVRVDKQLSSLPDTRVIVAVFTSRNENSELTAANSSSALLAKLRGFGL